MSRRPPIGQVLVGDAVERLKSIPDQSVDCLVTSPPYFRLRNYGHRGQLGLEDGVHEWVANLVAVLGEARRTLTDTGTVWLNVGDSYSRSRSTGAAPKSLVLAPERLLVALAADGWWVRNKVVWAKPNPMPTSVGDRLATTWEPVFLLTKSPRYFFDLDAVRVPHKSRPGRQRWDPGPIPNLVPEWQGPLAGNNSGLGRLKASGLAGHPLGKNPGDVWRITTSNFRGGHHATYPEALVERPILAGCPAKVCRRCNTPWTREPVDRTVSTPEIGAIRPRCRCRAGTRPGVVLDPFLGSGTTAVVAERLDRDWIGIDVNPRFAAIAQQRIEDQRQRAAPASA
ncbi:MAG: site-specific DNA-methyltransferase [Acidimicrobiia bacterium]